MNKLNTRVAPEDQSLLTQAAEILDSTAPPLLAQRELIMEVLRALLDTRHVKQRIKLVLTPQPTTALEGRLSDRIAAVVGQTYAELGDAGTLADDEAIEMIRDLLLGFDSEVIDRNRFRKLRRWPLGGR